MMLASSLYKGSIGDKEIKILDYSFNLKEKTIDKLNNNFLSAFYSNRLDLCSRAIPSCAFPKS